MTAQPELPLVVEEEGFDDTPAGQLAHIKALLDRDEWAGDPKCRDLPYRVYIVMCALACRRDMSRVMSTAIPLLLKLADVLAVVDPDDPETAELLAAVQRLIPR